MRYKIRPIGYEDNDPVKIRAALKAGCGGVIVPQNISDIVTAEIDAVKARADEYPDMIEKFRMTWHGADKKYPAHHWSKPQESLTHTYRWLEDIWARAVSQRLVRPPVPGISSNLVALWLGSAIDLPWHIDKQREDRWFDVHIHVSGEGLHVVSPRRELKMEFSNNPSSPHLKRERNDFEGPDTAALDAQLENHGVNFIRLQPGQAIYFNQHCLHKSAHASPQDLKLRAGIF